MKKIAVALLAVGVLWQARAADVNLNWLTSLPQAQAQAKAEHKLVLMDFTGSDWCPWCIKLDRETFSQPAFADYAKTNLVLVLVDFPNHQPQPEALQKANQDLEKKYDPEGALPTIIAMKPDGTVVMSQAGYLPGGPAAMIAKLNQARNQ
jgi:thioredoxin-related protein